MMTSARRRRAPARPRLEPGEVTVTIALTSFAPSERYSFW